MKKLFVALATLWLSVIASAGTITIPSGSTQAQIQTFLSSATSTNNFVQFQAGTYAVGSGSLTVPCLSGGITITGPTAPVTYTPQGTRAYAPTVTLTSASRANAIWYVSGCTNPITIENIKTSGAEFIQDISPSNGLSLINNAVTNIPCHSANGCTFGSDQAFFFYSSSSTSLLQNLVIQGNQIGDIQSCMTPASTMSSTSDMGGTCAGIFIQTSSNNVNISNNSFYHLEEGIHNNCFGDSCNNVPGVTNSPTWTNWVLQNNDFQAIHRINAEFQPQGASNILIANNSIENPFAPQSWSMGLSLACCGGNAPYSLLPGDVQCYPGGPSCASATPATPPVPILQGNVLIQNVAPPSGSYAWGYSIEFWGWGAKAIQNLVQGFSPNGAITYGAGSAPWTTNYNAGCGPNMGGAVASEGFSHMVAPASVGNTYSGTCSALTTAAPTVAISSTGTVTLTDAGSTSTTVAVPPGNVSIWYTTDGSTPAPNAGTSQYYTGPFLLPSVATVKAIGMWGQGANPISYPAGYGFVPSAVVSATYGGSTPPPPPPPPAVTLSGGYMQSTPTNGANTISGTGSIQLQVVGSYSDGSTAVVPNSQITWGTVGNGILSVSSTGLVTGIANGQDNVTATIGTVKSSQWTITVSGITPPPPPPPPPPTPTTVTCTATQSGASVTIVCPTTTIN